MANKLLCNVRIGFFRIENLKNELLDFYCVIKAYDQYINSNKYRYHEIQETEWIEQSEGYVTHSSLKWLLQAERGEEATSIKGCSVLS